MSKAGRFTSTEVFVIFIWWVAVATSWCLVAYPDKPLWLHVITIIGSALITLAVLIGIGSIVHDHRMQRAAARRDAEVTE